MTIQESLYWRSPTEVIASTKFYQKQKKISKDIDSLIGNDTSKDSWDGKYSADKSGKSLVKYIDYSFKNKKNLQRWNKKENNTHLISNPVGCIKQIDVKNIIELIKNKIKES